MTTTRTRRVYMAGTACGGDPMDQPDASPSRAECRKCDGNGLVSGDDEDGVFFDTCPKCNGTGSEGGDFTNGR